MKAFDKAKEGYRMSKVLAGIKDGRKAFTGPYNIQIDLTNNCNNDCIGCWCRSPLLGDQRMDMETQKKYIPLSKVIKLIDELVDMGGREIFLAGGGEPLMHPNFMEVLRYIKKKKLKVYINTNFTLADEEKIREMIKIGVDYITISVWAGTPEAYDRTHPNKSKEDFLLLKRRLKYFSEQKKNREVPFLKKYDVISNLNYNEIPQMVDFALETKLNAIEFAMLDPIEGKTECLLLNEKQKKELFKEVIRLKSREKELLKKGLILWFLDKFSRRVMEGEVEKGEYDKGYTNKLPCYVGWTYSRILANGDVNFCLKGVKKPVGNIYDCSFKKIWNNAKMREFRSKCCSDKEKDCYFKDVKCWKSCDNVFDNESMQKIIRSLGDKRRIMEIAGRWIR